MKLKLLLTFDHELPLGGTRTSYHEALFEPTQRLFDLAASLKVPVVLFTDVLSALRFSEWDEEGFYIPYIQQIQKAVNLGHDVQLHLHPHWLTSNFSNGAFVPSTDYKLADFEHHPDYPVERIIEMGKAFLDKEIKTQAPAYQCLAFRAGGYNLEGPRALIIKSLISQGIKYESSITKGYYFRSSLSEIDYREMPGTANWMIGENGNIRYNAASGLQEVPIASIPKTPFEVPTRFKLKKLAHQAPPDRGFQIHEGKPADFISRIRMMFSARMLSFDNYTLDTAYLMRILNHNVKKYAHEKEVRLCVSGHPKSMGDYSFSLMESFVSNVRKSYPDAEFTTFRHLYNLDYPS